VQDFICLTQSGFVNCLTGMLNSDQQNGPEVVHSGSSGLQHEVRPTLVWNTVVGRKVRVDGEPEHDTDEHQDRESAAGNGLY